MTARQVWIIMEVGDVEGNPVESVWSNKSKMQKRLDHLFEGQSKFEPQFQREFIAVPEYVDKV